MSAEQERNLSSPLIRDVICTGISVDTNPILFNASLQIASSSERRISWASFMQTSLDAYYGSQANIGRTAEHDFTTAPESSEAFGSAIAGLLKTAWQNLGRPSTFEVVEMGAGNGTLARQILTYCQRHDPELYQALHYTIIEKSPHLLDIQQASLQQFNVSEQDAKVSFIHQSASEIPLKDVHFFLSNELPDAFGVEIVRGKKVTPDEAAAHPDAFIQESNGDYILIQQLFLTVTDDQIIEIWDAPHEDVVKHITDFGIHIPADTQEPINLQAIQWQEEMDNALAPSGAILTIDYGKFGPVGVPGEPIWRQFANPQIRRDLTTTRFPELVFAGRADITTNVNFNSLARQAEKDGLHIVDFASQSQLLERAMDQMAPTFDDRMRACATWDELADVIKEVRQLRDIQIHDSIFAKNFHALLLQKGQIDLFPPNTQRVPTIPKVRYYVGPPFVGQEIWFAQIEKDQRSLSIEAEVIIRVDSNGYTEIPADIFWSGKFQTHQGYIVHGVIDEATRRQIIEEQLGIHF